MGYIYLLLKHDTDGTQKHKIGITKRNVKARLKELQTGNPDKIELLRFYESEHYLKIERWLHRKYGHLKTESLNEWRFLSDDDVLSFMKDCKEIEDNIKFLLDNNSCYE